MVRQQFVSNIVYTGYYWTPSSAVRPCTRRASLAASGTGHTRGTGLSRR
jgi:hypothetical protein